MNAIQKLSLKLAAGEQPAPAETKLFEQRSTRPGRPAAGPDRAARIPTRSRPRRPGR